MGPAPPLPVPAPRPPACCLLPAVLAPGAHWAASRPSTARGTEPRRRADTLQGCGRCARPKRVGGGAVHLLTSNIYWSDTRRLLFSTDVGSHETIIRARVDGNEVVELEGVTALALDQQYEEVIDTNGKNK
ncbi:uncharacterized protein LOC108154263 [Drosophila miranda]|uniref:uncharacterized protein LOC108154263 n=1 Tax=Drosophila miranda TaxID=7229 RepID=UPI0007E7A57F|nr:uncharacterized protein LOC108154263 [Drosophila miranda]